MRINPWQVLLFAMAGWINRDQQNKLEFCLEQLGVYQERQGNKRLALTDDQRRRLAAKGKRIGLVGLRELVTMVTPGTIMRWHRELVARKYDGTDQRRPGRHRLPEEVRSLDVRMANDNETWEYPRISGEMRKIGFHASKSSVARILKEHGIEPAPERLAHMPWSKFLKTHGEGLAAADFFTVEAWTRSGLTRSLVLFVIDLSTRRVEVAGIQPVPNGTWMAQIARNLVDEWSGCLRNKTHLILDRDPLFTMTFRSTLPSAGTPVVRLQPKSPNLNAYAGRFVLSIKSERLGRIIPIGERHLRRAINQYVEHYHVERPHQGLGNELIDGAPEPPFGRVQRRSRLGGILTSYPREAA